MFDTISVRNVSKREAHVGPLSLVYIYIIVYMVTMVTNYTCVHVLLWKTGWGPLHCSGVSPTTVQTTAAGIYTYNLWVGWLGMCLSLS